MTFEPLTPDRRRAMTRQHLLDGAAIVFARNGFHGSTLDEVAATAGFSKGAVYSNFKSKDDLFLELFHERVETRSSGTHRDHRSTRPCDGYVRTLDAEHAVAAGSRTPDRFGGLARTALQIPQAIFPVETSREPRQCFRLGCGYSEAREVPSRRLHT